MYKTSDFRGTACDGIRVVDMQNTEEIFSLLLSVIPTKLKEAGIPAVVSQDTVKSGGIFGSKMPMLIVHHPNPPTRFFDIGFVVNSNVISVPLLGESTQNTKLNTLEDLRQQGKHIRAMLVQPDMFILQQEEAWRASVISVFQSIFK